MARTTPIPTTEKRAEFTLAVVSMAALNQYNGQHIAYTNVRKTSSIYPSRSVKGGTNNWKRGSITRTPIAYRKDVYVPSNSSVAGSVIAAVLIL